VTPDPAAPDPSSSTQSTSGTGADLDDVIRDEIVRQSIDAVIITDPAGQIRTWNPGAERLYGILASDAIGRRVPELVESLEIGGPPLDIQAARARLQRDGVWRQRLIQRPLVGDRADASVTIDSVVTIIRDRAGDAIANLAVNRDMTTTARLETDLAALGSIVLATGQVRTKTDVAESAIAILCRATGADAGLVTSTDSAYEAIGSIGVSPATIALITSYGQLGGPLAQALKPEGSYVSADVATAPIREDVRAAVLADGILHLVIVGLRLSGRLIGMLALGWRHEKPSEPSRPILLQAAAVMASSLENARLLAAVESGLNQERLLTRRMRAMVELTRLPDALGSDVAASSQNRLVADVGAVIGADASVFGQFVGDGLELAASDGVDPDWAASLMDESLATAPIATRLADGATALLMAVEPDAAEDTAIGRLGAAGFRSVAGFAIRDDGTLIGMAFSLFRRPLDRLEIDERTLDAIGRVLEISFANRRLRERVLAGERRYRELFESSPDALLVQTVDEVVVDANPAAIRLYGGDVIGHSVDRLIAEDVAPPGRDVEGPLGFTQYMGFGRRLDGTTFPEEVDVRPIEIEGEPRRLVIVRDLTERSRMQGELVQAQRMEAIGLLVAGVAHELNNPLASIIAFSQLLRTDPQLPEDLHRQADLLVREANRTRVIVQNLLDFARQRPPERLMTELRPLIDGVLGLQSYILAHNRLQVEIDIPENLPRLSLDRSQMQQVLVNLTVNAAQAIAGTGRPGLIRIEARESSSDAGPTIRITIADDGPGVADSVRDRLFLPFVTTKEPGAGTGLGLSVSFGIVAGHGGTLRHEPNPGGGAMFVMELPVGRAAGTESDVAERHPAAAPAATGPASSAAGPSERPVRVLVLDDESSIRDFLGRVLVRSGYEALLASTGAEALEIVAATPPDAILCDHRMAGMSGTEFHTHVAAIDPLLSRRFAFMSGDVLNPELLDFATERGVQLLAKPFDIATVGTMVSRLLAVGRE
jgi:PAS domain S-box-containing protein